MLFLVVGPSGAGKDTLIGGARKRLTRDEAFWFPRRYVTRAADAGGEDHIAVDDAAFDRLRASDAFSLTWSAHGLRYALPAEIDDRLSEGATVVANVSRSMVRAAADRYPSVTAIHVTAPVEVLASRLAHRGREDTASVRERLRRGREVAVDAGRARVITFENTEPIGRRIDIFTDMLLRVARPPDRTRRPSRSRRGNWGE